MRAGLILVSCGAVLCSVPATASPSSPSLPSSLAGTTAGAVDPKAPCAAAPYRQLDFWLGDWDVHDGKSGQLVARDRITAEQGGCVIRQDMRFVTALYQRPGTPFRLTGTSISRFDGEQWVQIWADNQWGAIVMKGRQQPDGAMQFDTILPSRGRDVRLIWRAQTDGSVHIEQYAAKAGSGVWERYTDLVYRHSRRKVVHARNG